MKSTTLTLLPSNPAARYDGEKSQQVLRKTEFFAPTVQEKIWFDDFYDVNVALFRLS
jgi:hypothetical protein